MKARTATPIATMKVIKSTLRLNRFDPELPTGGTTTGGVVRFAGAECTTGRGVVAWTPGFFFTAGLVWRAFFVADLAFARRVTLCFGVAACAGLEVVSVGAGDVAGAGATTGAGVEAGAGAGSGLGVVCVLPAGAGAGSGLGVVWVLPLDVPLEVVGSCWTAAGGGSGLGLCPSAEPELPTSRESTASGKRGILWYIGNLNQFSAAGGDFSRLSEKETVVDVDQLPRGVDQSLSIRNGQCSSRK